jgi:hypothetical protein
MIRRSIQALLAASLLAGCSSEEAGPMAAGTSGSGGDGGSAASGAGGAGTGGAGGAGGSSTLVGTFTVKLQHAVVATMTEAFSVVSGTVYSGKVPPIIPLAVDREEGPCKLLKPKIPFCTGGCGAAAACVDTETCMPYPKAQNVGVVRVEGLSSAVTMDPFPPSYAYSSTALPYPPCEEGADVRLSADGFGAQTKCVAPLVLSDSGVVSVKRDQPVKVAWTAPGKPDMGRVTILLDVSHHGGKKGEIDCDVPDTGAFDIPASLVTALVDLGLAGFPTILVTRVASAPSATEPQIVLAASASVEREVDTGIKSCVDDTGCPMGQTCNKDNLTCR